MPVDKSQMQSTEGEPRRKRSALLEEALWSNLRSVYLGADKDAEFSPMTAGRIHQRMMVLKAKYSQKSRFSWNLAFSLAATFLLLLLVVPMFPPLPGTGGSQHNEMRQFVPSFDATSAGNPLPLEAPLVPKAFPIPDPTAEDFSSPAGMGSGGVQYDSVTLVFAAPEQLAVLMSRFPDAQQYADGTFLLASGDQEVGIPQMGTDLESAPICGIVVFSQAIQGTEEMPIGSDLLVLAPSSSFISEQASWPSLAWRAFLAQAWPWGVILALVSLIPLYFFFRQRRLGWAIIFFILLLMSLVLPLLSSSSVDDDRLLLESTEQNSFSLPSSLSMPMVKEVPLTILSAIGNPPSHSPFSLSLGAPMEDLSLLLENYGLNVQNNEVSANTVKWIYLPDSQLFPLQLTFLGLRALLLFVPLFLYAWLTFSRRLQVSTLKSEDRLPKLL